ncbi:redoxin domain-containing protein [Kineococcus radiotolerans]|uniref:Alkyl hydroperoxide reductase/ Thiol specific antioxidant/ Mal allergen n=1 Tax=Kineococcus radiotolerans (strain ATCC BAA-149 / DSM 14245 / SRS30216) TaxID=266940 RepID=A6W8Q3_KINRD|nr:redoxin domain-containing protein [Kineococcus radiotolerans]ABS03192.1 alkyl hydroperoxide reductase/ Thiol specific antioxidant/ Mal allergen [Kineococcus radiotolerans SRS30216 = ATCC BAA-149]
MSAAALPNHTGGTTLVGQATPGRVQVAWFFPKANTPGCTVQARQLVASWAALADDGVDVVGVSYDAPDTLATWARHLTIPFPLCTADLAAAHALGAARPEGDPWREALPARVALITDDHGLVIAHWQVHDVHSFVDQVRSALNLR